MSKTQTNPEIEITFYGPEDRPRAFWADMGPFFARREVKREMPYLADDDGYCWWVARAGKTVVGFASAHLDATGGTANLHGLYVVPSHRGTGIAADLIEKRLGWAQEQGAKAARVTANAKSAPALLAAGFSQVSEKGQYKVLEKVVA